MKFTSYVIKSFLKAPSDELLQRQKHEVSIDHEEFMTGRYTLISESSPRLPAPPTPVNQPGGQPGGQSDGQPDGQSLRQPTPSSPPPQNQSTVRQSPPTTENLEHPDGPPDGLPDGLPGGPLIEQSFKPSTSPLPPAHPSAPPTPVNQPRGQQFKPPRPSAPLTPVSQPMGQPMRRLMGQLMRRSMNQPISGIHVRCGIG
jgi:hypothetical protein